MSKRTLLWWIPAVTVAVVALVEGGMHMSARAAKHAATPTTGCATRELMLDVDGDGRPETLRLVRVGDQAWVDVWSGAALRSTTRIGDWHEAVGLEALDVNGDGKTDLVRRWIDGRDEHADVWLSDGIAFEAGGSTVGPRTCVAQR